MNERVFPAEIDRVAQETEKFRDEDEVNKEESAQDARQYGSSTQRGQHSSSKQLATTREREQEKVSKVEDRKEIGKNVKEEGSRKSKRRRLTRS